MKTTANYEYFRKMLRQKHHGTAMTYKEISWATGVHYTSICKIANGKQPPSLDDFLKIKDWLGKEVNDFLIVEN